PSGGLEALLDSGAMVLFDQAYGDFESGGQTILSGPPVSGQTILSVPPVSGQTGLSVLHPRLVTFRTFSKAWGLAALRLGWLASTAENCREIRKVKLPYSLNIISESAAIVALENRAV